MYLSYSKNMDGTIDGLQDKIKLFNINGKLLCLKMSY